MNGLGPENPWPGLASFTESDSAFFCGRSQEVLDVSHLVKREPLAAICGRSGMGKTSLLRAGLFPMLRAEGFLPVFVRLDFFRDGEPIRTLVLRRLLEESRASGIESSPFRDTDSLWEYFHHVGTEFWSPRNQRVVPVLVFDQFEEVLSLGRGEDAAPRTQAFLGELADLVENRPPDHLKHALASAPNRIDDFRFTSQPCKVVLAFREESLAEIEELRRQMPSLRSDNRFRLPPMNKEKAMDAILRPAGHLVSPEAAHQILRVAAGAGRNTNVGEIEPLILSMICFQLNQRRMAQALPEITLALVADTGGEILSQFYQKSLADLDGRARAALEDNLISEDGYRNSLVAEDLMSLTGISPAVLHSLVERRLLRMEERMGVPRVELTHDVLAGVMQASRDRRRASRKPASWSAQKAISARLDTTWLRMVLVALTAFLAGAAAAAAAWLLSR